jgi:hypothetical protein
VPWRFSDAGRRSAWLASWVPASENLHKAQSTKPDMDDGLRRPNGMIYPHSYVCVIAFAHVRDKA